MWKLYAVNQQHRIELRSGRRYRKTRAEFVARCRAINAPCWLCGGTINYQNNSRQWNSPELDHRYPASTHPHLVNEPSNFRIAHASCNQSRGAKDPTHIRPSRHSMHKHGDPRINHWTPTVW
jgi:5-methylcytosine-specific restriction endonuclease McrA